MPPPYRCPSLLEVRAVEVTGSYALDVIRARAAAEAAGGHRSPEWDAFYAARERWNTRPRGRSAPPGDLAGPAQEPGDYPHGGDIRCRRCRGVAGLLGHPYGCPQTPQESFSRVEPVRLCYCGQTMVAAPEIFGPCCEGTPRCGYRAAAASAGATCAASANPTTCRRRITTSRPDSPAWGCLGTPALRRRRGP
jgi:hypothetical protein